MPHRSLPGNVRQAHVTRTNNRRVLTNKCGRQVQCENLLQRRLALQLEYDPSVTDYTSFAHEFHYVDEHGRQDTHIPFLKIWRGNYVEFCDVISSQRREESAIRFREKRLIALCEAHGWTYAVETEKTLLCATGAANLEILRVNAPLAYADHEIRNRIILHLRHRKHMTVASLRKHVATELRIAPGVVFATIAHMIWHHEIQANITDALIIQNGHVMPDSTVWLVNTDGEEK
jgi:hypothetical protein